MSEKKEKKEKKSELEKSGLIAKKDWEINQEPYSRKIKSGEDISDVPAVYHQNLKTEGVL